MTTHSWTLIDNPKFLRKYVRVISPPNLDDLIEKSTTSGYLSVGLPPGISYDKHEHRIFDNMVVIENRTALGRTKPTYRVVYEMPKNQAPFWP
jgi:hypothetical protein